MSRLCLLLLLLPLLARAAGEVGAPQDDPAGLEKELEAYHKQAQSVVEQLQRLDLRGGATATDKARQKAMQLATDENFLKAAGDLWRHPDRDKMLMIQAGFFVLMIILKAWRQSKAAHWFRKLLIGFFFTILTWIGIVFAIPFFVLGEPYRILVTTLFRVVAGG